MPSIYKLFPRFLIVALLGLFLLLSACEKPEDAAPAKSSTSTENRIRISGSASVMPLLKNLAREFKIENSDVDIAFLPDGHSTAGIAGVAEGHYDIGAISREMFAVEKSDDLQ